MSQTKPAKRVFLWAICALSMLFALFQNCGPAKLSSPDAGGSSVETLEPAPGPSETLPEQPPTTTLPSDPRIQIQACAESSSRPGSPCERSYDRDLATVWNSGSNLAWIEYDLGSVQTIAKITLSITQSPSGVSKHQIYYGNGPGPTNLLTNFDQFTNDSSVLTWTGAAVQARYIRVQTSENPSWTAWREVELFSF